MLCDQCQLFCVGVLARVVDKGGWSLSNDSTDEDDQDQKNGEAQIQTKAQINNKDCPRKVRSYFEAETDDHKKAKG
jgi:hypothetical protein